MGKKSAPPPPDYTGAAEKTAQSNMQATTSQTWANRPTQIDPWGRVDWASTPTWDPATGQMVNQWTQLTTLDPRMQSALDSQIDVQQQQSNMAQGLLGRVRDEYSTPMDWGQLSPWQQAPQAGNLQAYTSPFSFGGPQPGNLQATTSPFSFSVPQQNIDTSRTYTPNLQESLDFGGAQRLDTAQQARQKAEDAIYGSASSRLDPQWGKRQTDLQTELANKGITEGSEAYTRAMADFGRDRNDAYNQAQMAAITGGGAEAQRNYGMDLSTRQQQVGEIGQQGAFTNQALGQEFGYGQQARAGQLAAQQAAYGQGLQGAQFGLGQQQQAFGQQQAAGGQNYDQAMAAYQAQLAQQQQAFGQAQASGGQNFQQQYQGAQLANQLRQSQLTEAMQRRGFSLNEIQALLNGQQVGMPQFQSFNTAGNWGGTDYTGAAKAAGDYGMQGFQAQQAALGNLYKGIGGIGGAAMSGGFFGKGFGG